AQREEQEEGACCENHEDDSTRQDLELVVIRAEKGRGNEKKIDRHVRNDHPWDKWNMALPFEIEHRNIAADRTQPIAASIYDQEQDRKQSGGPRALEKLDHVLRTASETVKMPHRSRFIASL